MGTKDTNYVIITDASADVDLETARVGGIKIIPNVNCPIPQKTELTLKDGETGRFEIDLVEPGVFDYTVQTVPDDRNIVFDDTVYSIKIYVTECVNTLEANMIATKSEGRRLIKQNGLTIDDEKVTDFDLAMTPELFHGKSEILLRKGKKKYYRLVRK